MFPYSASSSIYFYWKPKLQRYAETIWGLRFFDLCCDRSGLAPGWQAPQPRDASSFHCMMEHVPQNLKCEVSGKRKPGLQDARYPGELSS